MASKCELLIHRGFIGGGYDGAGTVRSRLMNGKKHRPKRNQAAHKGIWTTVKDNAGLIAAIIALFGVLITGAINTYIANKDRVAQQELQIFNDQRQRELEQDKARETALQAYLTDIGDLILDKSSPLRESQAGGEASRLARAKTLTVLQGLDGARKRILIQFLKEEELINKPDPIVDLAGADLSYAQLVGVDKDRNQFFMNDTNLAAANLYRANMKNSVLDGANLSRANLTEADLLASNLDETNLEGSNLTKANLRRCRLARADLSNARLEGATLEAVDLYGADLSGAHLTDAYLTNVDLSGADLSGAYLTNVDLSGANLTNNQLKQAASLKGAIMPNGQTYEDWLKSKDQ
jgi:uncharacterized protein YjbI with pentapeptide repeats